ncbi:MAG: hypothetical protein OEW12_02935 [Deltaproteobacteria bacterium]|nr:hypothetical protein [Deltaproteobacteria bacterium]
MAWTRNSAADWLRAMEGKPIRLKGNHLFLEVRGICGEVEELDACSTLLLECRVEAGLPEGCDLHLTLHDQSLTVHLMTGNGPATRISMKTSVPYSQLELEDNAMPKTTRRPPGALKTAGEPEVTWSPYELLHETRTG